MIMKKLLTAIVTAGALMAPVANAAELNIAIVDMQRALFASDAAQASRKQVESQFSDDIKKIKDLETTIIAAQEKLQKDGAVMSDDEKRTEENKIKEKRTEFQFFANKLKQAEQQWQQEFFRANAQKLDGILKAIIDEGKYDIVLNERSYIYAKPTLDLTKILLEKLNSQK
jgi:outer membrane protein